MTTAASDASMLARLATHRALGSAPAGEHAWLVAHGTPRSLAVGDVLTKKGELSAAMYVVLAGRFAIRADRGAGSHKIFEWSAGDIAGVLPFSRGARAPDTVVVEAATELLAIPPQEFAELIRECPAVTAACVHQMLDRTRRFNESDLRDEKLVSLGRLAAGLAHELNNPASAVVSSARRLSESIATAEAAATAMIAARLSDAQLAAVEAVRRQCIAPASLPSRSSMERADLEDEISEWLGVHGASDECAGPLIDAGVTIAMLDALGASVQGRMLDTALCWIAGCAVARALASEVETAASRIHDLVGSVKGFTFMDHAPTPEPVDIRRGIGDTVTMLGSKVRAKSAEVSLELPADLPRAHAVGAELNQVWMNLIDNALDAVGAGGRVVLAASREMDRVVVTVTDDGPGIPPEILGRIFDPFFTTKEVGQGTGMGLEIVRRILRRHEGDIEVDSRPGRTRFRVALPMER